MPATAIRVPLVRARLDRLGDDRLGTLAAAGDERAFEALYDRHHRALLGFCRHLLGSRDEAEDALQQTFLRAHRALLLHGPPDDLRPWLFTIARNRCKTLLAARRPDAPGEDEVEPSTEGLGADVERRADLRALLADVQQLPEDQKAALVLAELADLPHAEIGAVIGVPAAKVKALVHQARSRLIAEREARETPCEEIRELLATASGGQLRRGPLRRHLRGCEPCRAYKDAVAEQRVALGLLLPVLPSAGLKEAVLGAIGGGGGGAAAAAGGGLLAGGGGGLGAKLAVGAALVGSAGGGAVVVERVADDPPRKAAKAAPRPPGPPRRWPATRCSPRPDGGRGSQRPRRDHGDDAPPELPRSSAPLVARAAARSAARSAELNAPPGRPARTRPRRVRQRVARRATTRPPRARPPARARPPRDRPPAARSGGSRTPAQSRRRRRAPRPLHPAGRSRPGRAAPCARTPKPVKTPTPIPIEATEPKGNAKAGR